MSLHSFDPDIARKVGVSAAVVYQNFLFWCQKNSANRRHVRDGYVWTYNSRRALAELFPYLTESQIRTAIGKLVESGLLIVGNYNAMSVDKTSWYAPAVSAEWVSAIGEKSPMDWPKTTNGLAKDRQPIPDGKPVCNPDGKHSAAFASYARVSEPDHFEAFWQQYPHRGGAKKGKATARKAWDKAIKARASPEQIIGGAMRYAGDAQVLRGYAKDPATWINAKGWQDDVEQERPAAAGPTRGRGDARARAFLSAADATPAMDFGPGSYPSKPLLAGR